MDPLSSAPSSSSPALPWTEEEEDLVIHGVRTHGLGRWDEVGALLPGGGRTGNATYGHWVNCNLWLYADRDVPGALDEEVGWDPREDGDLVRLVLRYGEFGEWGKISKALETVRGPASCQARWFGVMKPIHVPLSAKTKTKPKPTPSSRARPPPSQTPCTSSPPPTPRAKTLRRLSHLSTTTRIPFKRSRSPSPAPSSSSKNSRTKLANQTPPPTPEDQRRSPASLLNEKKESGEKTLLLKGVEEGMQTSRPRMAEAGTQITPPRGVGTQRNLAVGGSCATSVDYEEWDRLWEGAKEAMERLLEG